MHTLNLEGSRLVFIRSVYLRPNIEFLCLLQLVSIQNQSLPRDQGKANPKIHKLHDNAIRVIFSVSLAASLSFGIVAAMLPIFSRIP